MRKKPMTKVITSVRLTHFPDRQVFEFSLPEHVKTYANNYIWKHVILDVVFQLVKGFKSIIEIRDQIYADDYMSYPDSICKREAEVLTLINPHFKSLFVELYRGIWSYDGLVTIYCCKPEQNFDSYQNDFLLSIAPFGDGEALEIRYQTPEMASFARKEVQEVLFNYHLTVSV